MIEFNDTQLKSQLEQGGITIIDFYAEWCRPCKMLAPVFEKIATTYGDRALFAKVDIEGALEAASNFGVSSLPTIIIFKDGNQVKRIAGLVNEKELMTSVEGALQL